MELNFGYGGDDWKKGIRPGEKPPSPERERHFSVSFRGEEYAFRRKVMELFPIGKGLSFTINTIHEEVWRCAFVAEELHPFDPFNFHETMMAQLKESVLFASNTGQARLKGIMNLVREAIPVENLGN